MAWSLCSTMCVPCAHQPGHHSSPADPGRFGPHATVPSNAPVFPDGYQTLATVLRDSGYDTGLFGKWHLGSSPQFGPNNYGFNTRGVKAQLYEGGIRTPLIVNWRGRLSASKIDHPVQVVDWMPTFSALTASEPHRDPCYDGRDIWPVITGKDNNDRRLFWNFMGDRFLGVRHGDWKLTSCLIENSRRFELFNIKDDPYEQHEVANDHPATVRDLIEMIEEERELDNSSARDDVASPRV